ncbi:sodium channel protein Nach-like [Anticarsia gemmatalis]|uniref:sodium channel protein Nach-like n=1 Tax=Anticarsia gemmatalis TaxID=129554 RepID=UPI003F757D0E
MDRSFFNHTVKAIGFHSSLSVVTDYEPADAIPGTILNAGSVRVMLTDWTEFPVDYETLLVDTNGESFMFLRATYTYCSEEVHALPALSRNCLFDNERTHRPFFHDYHNSDCDHMCFVMAIFKTCDCWVFFLPNLRFPNVCKLPDILCIMNVKKNMSYWLATSLCDCPRDCESRKYRAELSVGNFHAIPYLIKSQNPFFGIKFNASSSIMNFMFSNPVYMKQKQETVMSIISLVSNLGGVFGLFIGCSGISVLEILYYIYRGISESIRRRLVARRNNAVACQ